MAFLPPESSIEQTASSTTTSSTYQQLSELLLSDQSSLPQKFRAIFSLKSLGTTEAIDIISKAFSDSSSLLKHELAYILGQMRNPYAIPILNRVLADLGQDPMVRHEAAEALGAIGEWQSVEVLERYLNDDPSQVVRQTCELAIAKIRYDHADNRTTTAASSLYTTIDPAPAFHPDPGVKNGTIAGGKSISQLREILLDQSLDLFHRYRAMFTLRDIGTEEAVQALADGLLNDPSALFRHEVAYIFGQLQHPASVQPLKQALERQDELAMVRHECAEALGSIATEDCLPLLERYRSDQELVVSESCQVALDMYHYEQNGQEFQYALVPPSNLPLSR